ncbi:MAG: hypothetical protein K2L25_03050 [Alphaproteobacteria bacterium]|nr:hypothetical protein [Alphaproteobacteria bacterium]
MKKLTTSVLLVWAGVLGDAYAEFNCCGSVSVPVGMNPTYDSSCTTKVSGETLFDNAGCCASSSITSTANGVVSTRKCTTNASYNSLTNTLTAMCNCSAATYKCAVGYYGSPKNASSGCTRCPASGGVYGTTGAAGATSITECYLPSGTAFSDAAGSGEYTGNCYYVE